MILSERTVFLLACVFWGLTTALMLYVKLRKKADAFPVLILIGVFLTYMNAGDLFGSNRLYTIACVNRMLLAHQFITALVFGFMINSYVDVVGVIAVLGVVLVRPGWSIGRFGIPMVGPVMNLFGRKAYSLLLLGIVSQIVGILTGGILGVAMIDEHGSGIEFGRLPSWTDEYRSLVAFIVMLVSCRLVSSVLWRGRLETFFASAVVATVSRIIPLYASPLLLVPTVAIIHETSPMAMMSINTFIPRLGHAGKFRAFCAVMVWHAAGALAAKYSWESLQVPGKEYLPYVSKTAIAQELFFSVLVSFVAACRPRLVPLLMLGVWLMTVGADMPHLSSAVSIGADSFSDGRLIARILWQTIGALVGTFLVAPFADSVRINFDSLVTKTRTTDGKVID
jgi:hypothetical protein